MAAKFVKTRARADREATEWLLLSREFPDDPDLRKRFQAWLDTDPLNVEAWRETTAADALIGTALSEGAAVRVVTRRTGGTRRLVLGLVVMAFVLGGVSFRMPSLMLALTADYVTGTGERRDLRLTDGSMIFLAPESAVSVVFQGPTRRVDLLAGHAFFEVAPDPDRPFEVRAGDVTTRVLGTAFDERLHGDGAEIAVRHGLVRVDYAGAAETGSETLTAGNWLRVDEDGRHETGDRPVDRVGDWRTGELVVHDRRISDVIDHLRPYYRGAILVTDGNLGNRRVTGIYDLTHPERAMRAIAQAHGDLTVRALSSWLLVLSRR